MRVEKFKVWGSLEIVKRRRSAIGKAAVVIIVVVILVIAGGAVYYLTLPPPSPSSTSSSSVSSSSSTSSTSTSSSSSTSTTLPSSLTYETDATPQYLDPQITYIGYDLGILNNVYEYLLWYNGTSGSQVIPWLAQSYSISSNGLTVNFTLRQGISFADGEPFNSTSAYFSIYRGLVIDGASPPTYDYGPNWIQQQLANTSLSSVLSGVVQPYSPTWVSEVLGEDFVQITGPYTFTMHLQHYSSAFPYLWATWGAPVVAPTYTMAHDVNLWNSQKYSLPYPTLSGNTMTQIKQYFDDEVSTCGAGLTPSGCGETYYDTSVNGSLGGTGPYELQSYNPSTGDMVLEANPNYWGGPYQYMGGAKIVPQIKTIYINYVADDTTRLIDLESAAKSGAALVSTVTNEDLYDVANRTAWLDNHQLVSTIPGVSINGPFSSFINSAIGFDTNVTDPTTGRLYSFQPFADVRIRLAFSDAVNMSQIDEDINNNLGQVASNIIPPGLSPPGAYNASITPRFSYDLDQAQNLLLDAMMHPITSFTYANGTAAPHGVFNNTFGCASLNSNDQCSSPVYQTVSLVYTAGDAVDENVMTTIAENINNISATYNMGLTVVVAPYPGGQLSTEGDSGDLYVFSGLDWLADYPYITDYIPTLFPASGVWFAINHFNFTEMNELSTEAMTYAQKDDTVALLRVSSQMVALSNQNVMFLVEFYPENIVVMTSSIHGFYYNPSEAMGYECGGLYFATMY